MISIYNTSDPQMDDGLMVMLPRQPVGHPIIRAPGYGSDPTAYLDAFGGQNIRTSQIVMSGFPMIVPNTGNAWGNRYSTGQMSKAYGILTSMRLTTAKVAVMGDSMGSLAALNWAIQNRHRVTCFVGQVPVIDLDDVYDNNRWSFRSSINAAYGGSYTGGVRQVFNPMLNTDTLYGLPALLFVGSTDDIALPDIAYEFAEKIGPQARVITISGGHEESTYSKIDGNIIVDFLREHNTR